VKTNEHISPEELEAIEQYLDGSLPENDRLEFEQKIVDDPSFKAKVEDVKQMILGIEGASLAGQLDAFHDEMVPVHAFVTSSRSKSAKKGRLQMIRYVAAAAVIVAVGVLWLQNQGGSNQRLFAKHFAADPGLPTTMGSTENFEFYDAMVNYKQGDYKTAIEKWEVLLQTQTKNDTLHYFLGVAHLANGNEEEAIDFLELLSESAQNSFKNESAYYLGLAYLKADNVKDAKKYLTFSGTESADQILSELND